MKSFFNSLAIVYFVSLGVSAQADEGGRIPFKDGLYGPKGDGIIAASCAQDATKQISFVKEFVARSGVYTKTGNVYLVMRDFTSSANNRVIFLTRTQLPDIYASWQYAFVGQGVQIVGFESGTYATYLLTIGGMTSQLDNCVAYDSLRYM